MALNAAIGAARAGEIRQLAKATEKIRYLVKETGEVFKGIDYSIESTSEQILQTFAIAQNLDINSNKLMKTSQDITQMSKDIIYSFQELQELIEIFKI